MKRLFVIFACAIAMTGCGTFAVPGIGEVSTNAINLSDDPKSEVALFKAKAQAAKDLAPPPILEITAQPGQTIEFKGVASIKVNGPVDQSALKALFARDPKTWEVVADYSLRALEVFVNPWATLKAGKESAITQRLQIESNERQQSVVFGTMQGIATGAFNAPTYTPVTLGLDPIRPIEATPVEVAPVTP